jgi:hypothetical protein
LRSAAGKLNHCLNGTSVSGKPFGLLSRKQTSNKVCLRTRGKNEYSKYGLASQAGPHRPIQSQLT